MAKIVLNPDQLNEVIKALKQESFHEEKKELEDAKSDGVFEPSDADAKEDIPDEETMTFASGKAKKKCRRTRMLTKLKEIRKRYTSSFTMHALDHIINGTRFEKVFWTVKLITVLGTAIWLSRTLFISYFKHHVDTKVQLNTKTSMKLPMVFICGSKFLDHLESFTDCEKKDAASYNETICSSLKKKCPAFCKDKPTDEECSPELQKRYLYSVTCNKNEVLGQCITLNGDGKASQTLTNPGMTYKQNITKNELPLWVYVKAPGPVEFTPSPGMKFKWVKINRIGNYHFSIAETKIRRLPYPYNKPKVCVEEGTPAAIRYSMFKGNYTISKCLATCLTKTQINVCGALYSVARNQLRDKKVLEDLSNGPADEVKKCMEDNKERMEKDVNKCSHECPTPCWEDNYRMSARYVPAPSEKQIGLFFYYKEMKETLIEQSPSYHFSTLFANFGGTLGLMTGMSAISVIEMSIWMLLFCIDRCAARKKHNNNE